MLQASTLLLPAKAARPTRLRKSSKDVSILGIGTAAPPGIPQEWHTEMAERFCCDTDDRKAWVRRVFLRSGIKRRGVVLAPDEASREGRFLAFFTRPTEQRPLGPSTLQRMQHYAAEAPLLAEQAAKIALQQSQVSAGAITHLITASCTGFSAPGLDVAMINRLGLSPDVRRIHIGFMGCHAAFNALAAARDAALADRNAIVLVCCAELCSLHFTYDWDPGALVANGLFADGAAAAVVSKIPRTASGGSGHWKLRATASRLIPNSLDDMTWTIGDNGFRMTLSPQVPHLIREHIRPWCEQWLGELGLDVEDVRNWAIHPGGPKILSAVQQSLELSDGDLVSSREVFADHGNMSSPTILFILDALAKKRKRGPCVAIGFGPGLIAEGMLLT